MGQHSASKEHHRLLLNEPGTSLKTGNCLLLFPLCQAQVESLKNIGKSCLNVGRRWSLTEGQFSVSLWVLKLPRSEHRHHSFIISDACVDFRVGWASCLCSQVSTSEQTGRELSVQNGWHAASSLAVPSHSIQGAQKTAPCSKNQSVHTRQSVV